MLKALILAAGRGNRLSTAARGVPKPLLPLDGTPDGPTFLDWHVEALSALGVSEIHLVGNHATYGTRTRAMAGRPVHWILNPTEDLTTSGSGHSAWHAWRDPARLLDGASRLLLMDADIVYDPAALRRLVEAPGHRSKLLVHPDYRHTQEEVLVFGSWDRPEWLGKGLLDTPLTAGLPCLGEATGVLLWEPGDHATLDAVTDWVIGFSTAKARSEHEDLTQAMLRLGRMQAVALAPGDVFMEVDTPEEYRELVERVYPGLAAGTR